MFPEAGKYYVGGSAAKQLDVQNSVGEEMPLVMVISLAVVIAVLLLTSHAWL
jgi:predicted RND superfamily exporter protein